MVVFRKIGELDPNLENLLNKPGPVSRRELLKNFPDIYGLVGSLAGQIDLYISRGRLIARSWPRKPEQPNTLAQIRSRQAFSQMIKNWKYLGPADQEAFWNYVRGSERTPRDEFGKFYLDYKFKRGFWPSIYHVQEAMAWPFNLFVWGYTQFECTAEMWYWWKTDKNVLSPINWWSKFCEVNGLHLPARVVSSWLGTKYLISSTGYWYQHSLDLFFYDEPMYPITFIVVLRDKNDNVCGRSGLYCASRYLTTEGEYIHVIETNHGKYHPIWQAWYLYENAWQFPELPG